MKKLWCRGKAWLNRCSLIHKLIFIIIVVVLTPTIILSAAVYRMVYQKTVAEQETLRKVNMTNVIDSTEMILQEYEKLLDSFYDYDEILRAAYQSENWAEDTHNRNLVAAALGEMRKNQEFIASIALMFPNGSSICSSSGYIGYQSVEAYNSRHMEAFTGQLSTPDIRIKWVQSVEDEGKNSVKSLICASKAVKNIYHKNTPIGTLILHISTTALGQVSALDEYGDSQMLLITDENHQAIWKSGKADSISAGKPEEISKEIKEQEKMRLLPYKDQYYVISQTSEETGWNYINLISEDEIFPQLRMIGGYFLAIAAVLILMTGFCILLLNSQIFRPIRKLMVAMNSVDALDKIRRNIPIQRDDEIGCLYRSYNRLNERITCLIKELEEMYREDKNKEIKLLQSQLNPHFIYNTLESIGWVAYAKKLPEITQVLTCLSNILRYSIKNTGQYVTLGKELEMLKQYVYIQHFRFEDRFTVQYEIDGALLEYQTIKFIFQPFVENALIHGFKNMEEGCVIRLRVFEEDADILIEISDNGCGMSSYQIEHIRQRNTESIGIYNVDKALQLRYGSRYRIVIDAQPGRGTAVKLRIPKIEEKEQKNVSDCGCG